MATIEVDEDRMNEVLDYINKMSDAIDDVDEVYFEVEIGCQDCPAYDICYRKKEESCKKYLLEYLKA
jgi:hypothetical protein